MNVMLLAAGEGTRLRPFTSHLPKPAIPFLTIPLAAYSLYFLRDLEVDNLVVNTYHLPHKIHELFQNIDHKASQLSFSDEKEELLGSGGGLSKAKSFFQGGNDFILMNADEVILTEDSDIVKKAVQHHKKNNALATLLVMDHPHVGTQFGGVWTESQGNVLGFGKAPFVNSEKAWHFVGVQILSERVFKYLPEGSPSNILYDGLTRAIQAGECVQTFSFTGDWFETGNLTDLLSATNRCLHYLSNPVESFQNKLLRAMLNQFQPAGFEIKKDERLLSLVCRSASLDDSAKMEGLLVVGPNAKVTRKCDLKNVIIGTGVSVPEETQATDTLII